MSSLSPLLDAACARQDIAKHRRSYLDQDEFVVVEDFVPAEVLRDWDLQFQQLRSHIHRNFIPRHKKGGSVAYSFVHQLAPAMTGLYHDRNFIEFLQRLVDAQIRECPDSDPHRCALYSYTEEGDHIGWHYDTSYYKDRRWTVLAGFQDRSSSRLVCELHTRNQGHEVVKLELQIKPGTLVIFNGDKVRHCVTPVQAGESRHIISMQYVTDVAMNPFMRFVSNMKDAIAYFGFKGVFTQRPSGNQARLDH
jgi:hypothetical protein